MTSKVVAPGALLMACVAGMAGVAGAQEPTTTTTAPGATTMPGQPVGRGRVGTMFYEDENEERQLVADVDVLIEDSSGNEVATVTTDEEGVRGAAARPRLLHGDARPRHRSPRASRCATRTGRR